MFSPLAEGHRWMEGRILKQAYRVAFFSNEKPASSESKKGFAFVALSRRQDQTNASFPVDHVSHSLRSFAVRPHNAKYLHKVMKMKMLWSARVAKQNIMLSFGIIAEPEPGAA